MNRIKIFKKPMPFICLLINGFIIANYWFEQIKNQRILAKELANDPNRVIEGEFWRLFTSFLTHESIYQLILSSYLLIMEGAAFENLIGSVTYLVLFSVKMFLVSVTYCIWYLGLKQLLKYNDELINPLAEGAWMVILSDLVSRTFANPNELRIFNTISNKYYTLILLLIAFFVSYLGVHVLAIITIAFIEHKCFNGLIIRPYKSHIKCLEKYTCFLIFKHFFKFAFVSVDDVNETFFRIENPAQFEAVQQQNQVNANESFYGNSNYQGKLAIQQSYYSQDVKRWKEEDFDENLNDDVENPQQNRQEIEVELQ